MSTNLESVNKLTHCVKLQTQLQEIVSNVIKVTFQAERLAWFLFKCKLPTVQSLASVELVCNVSMDITAKMEVVLQFQFFVEENTANKQVNALDVLMDTFFKEENVFIPLLESIQLVKNTLLVDFVTNAH